MKRPPFQLGLLMTLLALPWAGAQQADPGTIEAIEVRNTGPGRIDRTFVDAHTSIREGDRLNRSAIARDVRRLLEAGHFRSVDADIEARADGVALIYMLARKLTLAEPVRFTGADRLPERKLRRLLDLEVGDRVDDHTLGVQTLAIRDEFVEDHYPNVAVSWEIEEVDRDEGLARVTVDIDAGTRSKVKAVRFEGNRRVAKRELRRAIHRPSRWNPLWLFRKRRYSGDELQAMRLTVRRLYRERGFLDVRVAAPAIDVDARGRQTVVVRIVEGAVYRFSDIMVQGVELFPQAEVESLVVAQPGVTASSRLIDQTVQHIRDFYGERGYAQARIRPVLETEPDANVVRVTFMVTEGELVRIGNVRIRGNDRTRDKVIRRELLVYPGDVLNAVKARRSKRRLMNLGYFSSVRQYEQKTSVPNREDVVYQVEEKRTGQFMVGAGFSSVDNIIGFMEISQGNFDIRGWPFVGGGQKLNLRTQFGSERRDYKLSFVEPWFLNRKLSLGFDLFRTDLDYSDYELKRTGTAIALSKALPGANRIAFRYSLEETVITDIADTNEYVFIDSPDETYFFNREADTLESTLKTTLTHDTRNNPFIPTRGLRASLFARLSGGLLGADTDVYGLGARSALYIPLWLDHVLSIKGRYETVDSYGGTDEVPISERLFAGGGRTIRGFDYRDVGPKVVPADDSLSSVSYRPVGGRSMALVNLEYTIPLVDGVRLAAFYDIGGVWRDSYAFNADNLASGAGLGLRLDMPGFPIRLDRAWAVDPDDDLTDMDDWVIWIGYDY